MSSPATDNSDSSSQILKVLGEDFVLHRSEVPVSPPPGPPLAGGTPEEKRVCNLWNKYGGAIGRCAADYGISADSALAVFYVESGQAYDPSTGLLIIRFEPHIFEKKAGKEIAVKRQGQKEEWQNLDAAYQLDPEAAVLSCSYGLPQLMGFNWKVTRHPGVKEMVLAFQNSCEEQVAGFFGFVEKNNLLPLLQRKDWRAFTRRYNGPGNVEEYSGRLIRALKVVQTLKGRGAGFEV